MAKADINFGTWTERGIDELLEEAGQMRDVSGRIATLSARFLGAAYGESTLIGDRDRPEVLVVNLEHVDCFTFIDYIEAMRLSRSFEEFKENLVKVRYQSGKVSYLQRNHFFTDWIKFNKERLADVTGVVGGKAAERNVKTLNLKEDGTLFLDGIAPGPREVNFIPSKYVDEKVLARLKTGDYGGIYSERAGIDVSHVGIIIKDDKAIRLRHASSLQRYRRVIDQDLRLYLADKPGLLVLRPRQI
jgi:hypothetical protein